MLFRSNVTHTYNVAYSSTANIYAQGLLISSNGFTSNSVASASSAAVRIFAPGGAAYASSTASVTGAFKIRLPQYRTDTMMKMVISMYDYSGSTTGNSRRIEVGGYNYSVGSWYNTFATQTSMSGVTALNVRFGHDGTYNCI